MTYELEITYEKEIHYVDVDVVMDKDEDLIILSKLCKHNVDIPDSVLVEHMEQNKEMMNELWQEYKEDQGESRRYWMTELRSSY